MGLKISGYVVEPPRIGAANAPYTYTPNVFVEDQTAFDAVYPSGSEPSPRADYMVLVEEDGSLADAKFGWTKNEIVQRFDYASQDQRFSLLGGGPLIAVGPLASDSNTTRLQVTVPVDASLTAAPFRLSVGSLPGTPFTIVPVPDFLSPHGSPATLVVEMTPDGKLCWNSGDLVTYVGQTVWFQRQQFYTSAEGGKPIGVVNPSTNTLLNPLPATGQYPRIRIGFGPYLTPIEVASFSAPATGTVQWNVTTGALWFSAADFATYTGQSIYYDGVLLGTGLSLPRQTLANPMPLPSGSSIPLTSLPAAGGDMIFRTLSMGVVTYQFPYVVRIDASATFDSPGTSGVVQVKPHSPPPGAEVLFSVSDRKLYYGQDVECISGDLPLERGISLRLFRCSANLDGANPAIKDVASLYAVTDATLASPIVEAPMVFLPAVPLDDGHLAVRVDQRIGTFEGPLARLDDVLPPVAPPWITTGFTIDFEGRQIHFGERKNSDAAINPPHGIAVPDIAIPLPAGAVQLPDTLLSSAYLNLQLDEGSGFSPLVLGTDALLEPLSGTLSFVQTNGSAVPTAGSGLALFTGDRLQDTGAFHNVQQYDLVIVPSGTAEGVYTVISATDSELVLDMTLASPVSNVPYAVRRGSEVLADRFWSEAEPVDPNTRVERILRVGTIPSGSPYLRLSTMFRNGSTVVFAPSVTITTVPDDSKFSMGLPPDVVEVSLSTGNLNLTRAAILSPRFRFGESDFSTASSLVQDALAFTPLPAQQVEISLASGEINFSSSDVGKVAYAMRRLRRRIDYRMTAHLGFVEFTDRMFSREEALVTYAPLVDGVPAAVVPEPVTWIVRKETTQPHPSPTSTLSFNLAGRRVAKNPPPIVFRGGRPQTSDQVVVDTVRSTIRFLPDKIRTNALPHGSQVTPDERVYIDYYVYDAVGGEKTTTVLQPPLSLVTVDIQEGLSEFLVNGDQTATFPDGYLLRVEQDDVYLIGTSAYDSGADQTTVTLAGQIFRNSLSDPKLYTASGPTPLTSGASWRTYFRTEMSSYDPVARGMNRVAVAGNHTDIYRPGAVLLFTDGVFSDTYLVSGAAWDSELGRTVITTTQNAVRQYTSGTDLLRCSVRPILNGGAAQAQTHLTPILTQPYTMYRRLAGQPGRVLTSPTDYTLDDAGAAKFTSPLLPGEEMTLLYIGHRTVAAGSWLRADYTHTIAPSAQNGLLNQALMADYDLYSPDTFYFRVEKLSNFQAEVAAQLESDAKGSSPAGGPMTSNASAPQLWEQGRESLFFPEGHAANVDIVMRAFLKFYNDAINYLEDLLQDMDGRVVGDGDGRFLFDGKIDNAYRGTWAAVTNQIDDIVQVSKYPIIYSSTYPPSITYIGTWQPAYQASQFSRFFPTFRASLTGFTIAGANTGDWIADLRWANLTGTDPVVFRMIPRAMVVRAAAATTTRLYVDNVEGASDPTLRPTFTGVTKVIIPSHVSDAAPLTVVGIAPSPPYLDVSALPVDIPAGATVCMCTTGSDKDPLAKNYRVGTDANIDLLNGKLTFVKKYFPFDGSVPLIPSELCVQEVPAGIAIQVNGVTCNSGGLAPVRFPALDGKPIRDCGDQLVPMMGPSLVREETYLADAIVAINALTTNTTPPTTLFGGSLNAGVRTTISVTGPGWPGTPVQLFDLVRITSGLPGNIAAGWRRVTGLGASSIIVDTAFPLDDTNFDFVVTAGAGEPTSTASFPANTLTMHDAAFPALRVGQTIVFTSGAIAGVRRQIVSFPTPTDATLDYLVPGIAPGVAIYDYRASNHLATFGPYTSPFTPLSSQIVPSLQGLIGVLGINVSPMGSEIKSIERLFDGNAPQGTQGIFTDVLSPALTTHPGTVSGNNTITRNDSVDLSGVSSVHFVFVRSGANQGIYSVGSATASTVTIQGGGFPANGAVDYRVVQVFGLGKPALQDILCILKSAESMMIGTASFSNILTTRAPVTVTPADLNIFATYVTTDVLNALVIFINDRIAALPDPSGPIAVVQNILTSRDKLYDQRFTWIDARINAKSGWLAKRFASILDRAVKSEEQAAALTRKGLLDKLTNPQAPSVAEEAVPSSCP